MLHFVILLVLLHTLPLFGGVCKIYIRTKSVSVPLLTLERCEVEGKLFSIGPFLAGKFLVDVTKLFSRNPEIENAIKGAGLSKYARFELDPLTVGDREFSGTLKLNHITRKVRGIVVNSSTHSLDTYFTVNLAEFGLPKNVLDDMFDTRIDVIVRIPDERIKTKDKGLSK